MEIQFQQQKQNRGSNASVNKTIKFKGKNRLNNNDKKFVGVRQRPSGRWVAEIKDTTQKIRMWLGTFETADEAARAYDQAACLLRGANTRTNFVTHVSLDSPLASRIRNLLNNKIAAKERQSEEAEEEEENLEVFRQSSDRTLSTSTINESSEIVNSTEFSDDVYKPDMSNCKEDFEPGLSPLDFSWSGNVYDRFSFTQELLDFPKGMMLPEMGHQEFTEFDRIKVERSISASLYAMNGVHEYMETVYDPLEALWDLPPIC